MEGLGELGVVTHPAAVAADVDDVAVMDEPIDERGGHDVVTEHVAPVLEALVRGRNGRGVLVVSVDELEEEQSRRACRSRRAARCGRPRWRG